MLEIKQAKGVYYLYINGEFYCSCDNDREVDDEIAELQRNNIILNWEVLRMLSAVICLALFCLLESITN